MADREYPHLYSFAAAHRDDAVAWLHDNLRPENWSIPDDEPFDGRVYVRFRDADARRALHEALDGIAASGPAIAPPPGIFRLHIGGKAAKADWRILDIQPGPDVDYVGDCSDLSRFPDDCCDEIYASHVVEHIPYKGRLRETIIGFHRVLKPGGTLRVSVPDLDILCRLFVLPELNGDQRFHLMRIMFGGQTDAHDFHMVGLNFEFLSGYLNEAKFSRIARVEEFGIFDDASSLRLGGHLISLNVEAVK